MVWKRLPPHDHSGAGEGGTINTPAATITTLTATAIIAASVTLSGLISGVTGYFSGSVGANNITASSMTVTGGGGAVFSRDSLFVDGQLVLSRVSVSRDMGPGRVRSVAVGRGGLVDSHISQRGPIIRNERA